MQLGVVHTVSALLYPLKLNRNAAFLRHRTGSSCAAQNTSSTADRPQKPGVWHVMKGLILTLWYGNWFHEARYIWIFIKIVDAGGFCLQCPLMAIPDTAFCGWQASCSWANHDMSRCKLFSPGPWTTIWLLSWTILEWNKLEPMRMRRV
jgi:hypothetical protein